MSSVSLVIPIFNGSQFFDGLTRLVDELRKSEFDQELIIVDDGSSPQEVKALKHWKEAIASEIEVKNIFLDQNKGPGHARNAAIEASTKDYITFLDADDSLDVISLQGLAASLSDLSFPHLVETSFQIDRSQYNQGISHDRSLSRDTRQDIAKTIEEFLEFRREHSVLGCLFRTDFLQILHRENGGELFPDGYHEDVLFWWKFLSRLEEVRGQLVFYGASFYTKVSTPGSIVNRISRKHLEDYIHNWIKIGNSLLRPSSSVTRQESYLVGSIALVATRAREIIRHERDIKNQVDLMHLLADFVLRIPRLSEGIKILEQRNQIKTQYQMIAEAIVAYSSTVPSELTSADLVNEVALLSRLKWSCQYIQESIFFRSNEIRTCCKRFFKDGAMKGDIKLEVGDLADLRSDSILRAKIELLNGINNGSNDCCTGCPFLELRSWQRLDFVKPKYVSIENHSICNLRCSYCSEEYWGGKKPTYSLLNALSDAVKQNHLNEVNMIVWGGGEPTLAPDFDKTFAKLEASCARATQRVITNSTRYSHVISDALKRRKAQIITSIDAGTEDTFYKVRGGRFMNIVLQNLTRYSLANHRRVTIKYILESDNSSKAELRSFANLMAIHGLLVTNFQISSNFKEEVMPRSVLNAGIELFLALKEAGANHVYYDDLFISRLPDIGVIKDTLENSAVSNPGLLSHLPDVNKHTVVWGAGQLTELINKHTLTGSKMNVLCYIDDTTLESDQVAFQRSFQKLSSVDLDKCDHIFISAVQGYALIREKLALMGFEQKICSSFIL